MKITDILISYIKLIINIKNLNQNLSKIIISLCFFEKVKIIRSWGSYVGHSSLENYIVYTSKILYKMVK